MLKAISFAALVALNACGGDETIARFADPDTDYALVEMGGTPFDGDVTIAFPDAGQIVGQGPCNRYFADQSDPYPWFNVGPIAATRMACPALDVEAAYFAALDRMTLAEVLGDTLILTGPDDETLVFKAR